LLATEYRVLDRVLLMAKARDESDFFHRVWMVVARIPRQKVTTYGHIAEYLGVKSAARTVGWALQAAKGTGLPCHRVVNRFGALSGARHFGSPNRMENLLRREGVTFDDKGCVCLEKHLWIPGMDQPRKVCSVSQKDG